MLLLRQPLHGVQLVGDQIDRGGAIDQPHAPALEMAQDREREIVGFGPGTAENEVGTFERMTLIMHRPVFERRRDAVEDMRLLDETLDPANGGRLLITQDFRIYGERRVELPMTQYTSAPVATPAPEKF